MQMAIDSLAAQPSQQNLDAAQAALKTAYLGFQKVSHFDFGPAETTALKSSVNIYKTDTAKINASISSGSYNLDQLSMKSSKGFPALDYLLFGKLDAENIKAFQQQTNRCEFLKVVTMDIKAKANATASEWESSYQSYFVGQEGTDAGSSTGILVNSLNLHFEQNFRDYKIGIPLGVRSSGIPRPDFCEAVYGQYSIELALENFKAMKNLYLGVGSTNGNSYGLDDYLIASNATELNTSIINQLNTIELKLNTLSDPLPAQIDANPSAVQEAYTEMQKLIVFWKVDLPSRMGVLITYQDNDGD
jgi:hypothetical protein